MSDTAETGATETGTTETGTTGTESTGTESTGSSAVAPLPRRHRLWAAYRARISFTGQCGALILLWLSATPSLLPRDALFQGVVSGGAAALGYGLGVFFSWLVRFMISRDERWPNPPWRFWTGLAGVFVIGTAVMFYWFGRWQNEIRDLMGVDRLSWSAYPQIVVIALVVYVILMLIGQGWGAGVVWLVGKLNHVAPPRISAVAGLAVVVLVTVLVLNGVVANYSMQWLNASFAAANDETKADTTPPTDGLRSGGPGSLVSWSSLGREGRIFVSRGPSVEQLSTFNGAPAREPVRAFVGLGSGNDLRANAALAATELVRAGGLTRRVIAIGATTGSGWLNKATVDSLEYMYNGDVATVSMQYSYLPSWLSFLVDSERARQAGSALFEAVDARVRALPEAQRPKVVVFGESLGSFGAEAAFGTVPTVAARTDGALFVGPTFNNTLWSDATTGRDAGSPQWLPIVADGATVRFIAEPADLDRPAAPWPGPRVVYLQHASDPIAWWSPDLILSRPDWLREARGRDVLGAMTWIPFVTFLQVSADMAVSVNVPDGHGHHYLSAIPYAWARILNPPGWTDDKTRALLGHLRRD